MALRGRTNGGDAGGFRVPPGRIIATHFLGRGWAPDCWSYLDPATAGSGMAAIRDLGFNTLILPVPWTGFQTRVDPPAYYRPYWHSLEQVIETARRLGLWIILRMGYAHDNGPASTPPGRGRHMALTGDAVLMRAWRDFAGELWKTVAPFDNVLGGFISWEDFFLPALCREDESARLEHARRTGYQDYLRGHCTLEKIAEAYDRDFSDYDAVPVPAPDTPAMALFSRFWDEVLTGRVFEGARRHFPRLTLEVRIDTESLGPGVGSVDHAATYDVATDVPLTMLYFTPGWGADNSGREEPPEAVLERLERLLLHVRDHTGNHLFIDQFNFIDNTPGFEGHNRIQASGVGEFLAGAAPLLERHTAGYGLWTVRDVPANILKNGLFAHDYDAWTLTGGVVVFDRESGRHVAELDAGGSLEQMLVEYAGEFFLPDRPFTLEMEVRSRPGTTLHCLSLDGQGNRVDEHTQRVDPDSDPDIGPDPDTRWRRLTVQGLYCRPGGMLRITAGDGAVGLTALYLYQHRQENGVLDKEGREKSFAPALRELNRRLAGSGAPAAGDGRQREST